MRNLLFVGLLLIAASMAGWFRVNREGDRTLIEIDRSEIRDDARRAFDRGREFLDAREERIAQEEQQQQWQQQQWQQLVVAIITTMVSTNYSNNNSNNGLNWLYNNNNNNNG